MVRRHYALPSLNMLAVFEAAARHLSFKDAARELNVTPGAVSRQIKALETDLGDTLFERIHRGVRLTDAGDMLYATLRDSFSQISASVRTIRTKTREASVTIGATTAFASLWLMPRLGDFWRSHQEITVNHLISDDPRELNAAQVDLRIRYGNGRWPGETAELLFEDSIYPVCGPEFLERHNTDAIDELLDLPLLQLNTTDASWIDWPGWLDRLGIAARPRRARSFTNYVVALQAAQDNQGVALGWHRLVEPLISQGRLARFGALEITAPDAFYVTWSAGRELAPAPVSLKDWLTFQSTAFFG